MNQTIEVPIWYFLFYFAVQILLYVLDTYRAKIWTKYIDSVNSYVGKTP